MATDVRLPGRGTLRSSAPEGVKASNGSRTSFQRALNNRLPSVQQIPAESVGTLDAATRAAIAAALPGVGTEGTVTPAVLEAVTR